MWVCLNSDDGLVRVGQEEVYIEPTWVVRVLSLMNVALHGTLFFVRNQRNLVGLFYRLFAQIILFQVKNKAIYVGNVELFL